MPLHQRHCNDNKFDLCLVHYGLFFPFLLLLPSEESLELAAVSLTTTTCRCIRTGHRVAPKSRGIVCDLKHPRQVSKFFGRNRIRTIFGESFITFKCDRQLEFNSRCRAKEGRISHSRTTIIPLKLSLLRPNGERLCN